MRRDCERPSVGRLLCGLAAATTLGGCTEEGPAAPVGAGPAYSAAATFAAPAPLVPVVAGGVQRQIWPFTGTSLGAEAQPSDPINLIFTGASDPRSIRAALMALDGERFWLPPFPFFRCTWTDAMGDNQTGYAAHEGWTGSAIQLECGPYQGLRFHLRLFRAGDWTLGNAHFETIIPGTHQHEVLSWELAQQFVVMDMVRTGLLGGPPLLSGPINPQPFFRSINPLIYNNPALAPLHPLINAVIVGSTIGIRSTGHALVIDLARSAVAPAGHAREELVIQFNQVIPKPICAGPLDFVLVQGPLRMRQDVTVSAAGVFNRQWHVDGDLNVTPINPFTMQPAGPAAQGVVSGLYRGSVNDVVHSTSSLLDQSLQSPDGTVQQAKFQLQVGPRGALRFRNDEQC